MEDSCDCVKCRKKVCANCINAMMCAFRFEMFGAIESFHKKLKKEFTDSVKLSYFLADICQFYIYDTRIDNNNSIQEKV